MCTTPIAAVSPDSTAQYTSFDFGQILDDHGVLASLGSVGDAYDTQLRMPLSLLSFSL